LPTDTQVPPSISDSIKTALRKAEYLAVFNGAGDVIRLAENGYPVKDGWIRGDKLIDGYVLSKMVDENSKGDLESTLLTFDTVPDWKSKTDKLFEKTGDMGTVPADLRAERCRLDAWAGYRVAEHFHRLVPKKLRPLAEFTTRVSGVLSRINLVGAIVDRARFESMGSETEAAMRMAEDQLNKAALTAGFVNPKPSPGGHSPWTVDANIRTLLYDTLSLPILDYTDKSAEPSVSKPTLLQLADNETVRLVLEFAKHEKRYSTNVVGLSKLLHDVGTVDGTPVSLVRFNINPLGARTGRRSSNSPNSQNWPKAFRAIVRSRWPGGQIAELDYKSLEVVLIAWLAGDWKLLDYFTTGQGYIDVARDLLGYSVAKDTPMYRAIKSIVLGVHYNMQTELMAHQLWILYDLKTGTFPCRMSADYRTHVEIVDGLRDKYLRTFPGLQQYMLERRAELLRCGGVTSLVGRVRHLPLTEGHRTPGFGHKLNQAINFPVQSLACECTGAAMVGFEEDIVVGYYGGAYGAYLDALIWANKNLLTTGLGSGIIYPVNHSLLINEVHDSLVLDLHPDTGTRDLEMAVENMKAARALRALCPDFDLPLHVDVAVGPAWGVKGAK
jgi:DNA polymerase I-like protein with 3'-5' exonuclease and polymerase domains